MFHNIIAASFIYNATIKKYLGIKNQNRVFIIWKIHGKFNVAINFYEHKLKMEKILAFNKSVKK